MRTTHRYLGREKSNPVGFWWMRPCGYLRGSNRHFAYEHPQHQSELESGVTTRRYHSPAKKPQRKDVVPGVIFIYREKFYPNQNNMLP